MINKQTKKKLRSIKQQFQDAVVEKNIYKDKYISLLEEKGEGFNQYLFYQNKYNELGADIEEMKKNLADYKKDMKDYDNVIKRVFNREPITSLAHCHDYDDFITYLMRLYASNKDFPLKGIQDVCKKLNITKSMIKKDSEYMYKVFDVDKWIIE